MYCKNSAIRSQADRYEIDIPGNMINVTLIEGRPYYQRYPPKYSVTVERTNLFNNRIALFVKM